MLNTKDIQNIDIHQLKPLKMQVYYVLAYQALESKKDRCTVSEITDYLINTARINTSQQAVRYALKSAKSFINKNNKGYKLMTKGYKEIKPSNDVIIIEPDQQFKSKTISIKSIFNTSTKELRICDPYVGTNTLDVLFRHVDKQCIVKILTSKIINKPTGIINRILKDLHDEGYHIELKIYSASTLHDRYIIYDKGFWLSGNSLNNLGKKESFFVPLGIDIQQSMLATFNNRWKSANTFTY